MASTSGIDSSLRGVSPRVTYEMNSQLLREFTQEEIDFALSEMHPLKSPRLDSFSACFYQRLWTIVGVEVHKTVLNFLHSNTFYADINATFIALIPKASPSTKVTEFQPISLCNILYKLIVKVTANRLKKLLPSIISCNQSAFIPCRLIYDNVLVAFEALHTMDTKLKGKKDFMALKLDMSNAYDHVEWEYLESIMRRLGFAERWIHLTMSCVKTVSYSVLINGSPQWCIIPTRGLRQGNHLSPYLFLLCAEGLSSLLSEVERMGRITGLPIARGGPSLSHLFFTDDNLLFCRATFSELCIIHGILESYEQVSG